jgi:hypothetical protein
MKINDFRSCYNENSETGESFGSLVADFAYQIIPDIDASQLIRQEVMEIGSECCAEFEVETAWEGTKSSKWPGLKEVTRECCKKMILLPESENPLVKPNLQQRADDPWGHSIAALPFAQRQVFLLSMGFDRSPRNIIPLLNGKKTAAAVKDLQTEALEQFIANLIGCYPSE